jgi:hypothetical protein
MARRCWLGVKFLFVMQWMVWKYCVAVRELREREREREREIKK